MLMPAPCSFAALCVLSSRGTCHQWDRWRVLCLFGARLRPQDCNNHHHHHSPAPPRCSSRRPCPPSRCHDWNQPNSYSFQSVGERATSGIGGGSYASPGRGLGRKTVTTIIVFGGRAAAAPTKSYASYKKRRKTVKPSSLGLAGPCCPQYG